MRDAPVVVPVISRKSSKIPVSKSNLMSEVQLYLPICNSGGPLLIAGKLTTVGLAFGDVNDDGDPALDDATAEAPLDDAVAGDVS